MSDITGESMPTPLISGRKSGESPEDFELRTSDNAVDPKTALLLEDPDAYDNLIEHNADEHTQTARMVGRAGAIMTLAAMQIPGLASETLSKGGEIAGIFKRDVLQEPWDLPDHVGNFTEAGIYTGLGHSVLNFYFSRREGGTTPRTARKAAIGAFLFSSTVQLVGEKYVRLGYNSGDMVDAAYGVVYSAGAAAVGYLGITRTNRKVRKHIDSANEIITESNQRLDKVYGSKDNIADASLASDHLVGQKAAPKDQAKKKAARKSQKASRKNNRRK